VQAGSGLRIDVDPGRIAQVLRNLVTNAVKYTPPGTAIELRAWADPARQAEAPAGEAGWVWLAVVDAGPGIAPEDRELIFAKFGRARQTGEQAIPGLGLGLYLSQRIVAAHGGELVVSAPPSGGACFAFSVPRAL
jgi:signal transduction histidine kinase